VKHPKKYSHLFSVGPFPFILGFSLMSEPASCKIGHACVPKRHFGVQAWVNRSSRLRTAVDLKSYGKGRASLKVNSSGGQERPCFSMRRFAPAFAEAASRRQAEAFPR
jgi:hypothetical protein